MSARKRPRNSARPPQERGQSAGRISRRTELAAIKPKNLRIIGGRFRGRPVRYLGDRLTRPMKDNVRENLFNVIGKQAIQDVVAWDLFAGTGILGIETVSRGATEAICIEWNRPAAQNIRRTVEHLGMSERVQVLTGDTFRITPTLMKERTDLRPWIVFVCPPYAFWDQRSEELLALVQQFIQVAPEGSLIVTETDAAWDLTRLPGNDWDVRRYGNTHLAFAESLRDRLEPA